MEEAECEKRSPAPEGNMAFFLPAPGERIACLLLNFVGCRFRKVIEHSDERDADLTSGCFARIR